MLIKLLEKIFNPLPAHLINIEITFVSAGLAKVKPFFDGQFLYDKVVAEYWKIKLGDRKFDLRIQRYPSGCLAFLNDNSIPIELAELVFHVFFYQDDIGTATRLACELSKYKN